MIKCDRHELAHALKSLGEGDTLLVTRLDRLVRSMRGLLNTPATITGKGAGFRSLNDTWVDTTTAHGRLILIVLGGLAEFERKLIRARTGEGRARTRQAWPQAHAHPHHQEAIKRGRRRARLRAPTM